MDVLIAKWNQMKPDRCWENELSLPMPLCCVAVERLAVKHKVATFTVNSSVFGWNLHGVFSMNYDDYANDTVQNLNIFMNRIGLQQI